MLSGTFSLEIGIEQDKSKLNLNKMISFGLLLSYFSASLGNKGPRIELSLIQNQIPMNSDDEYTTIQILGSKLYHIVLISFRSNLIYFWLNSIKNSIKILKMVKNDWKSQNQSTFWSIWIKFHHFRAFWLNPEIIIHFLRQCKIGSKMSIKSRFDHNFKLESKPKLI